MLWYNNNQMLTICGKSINIVSGLLNHTKWSERRKRMGSTMKLSCNAAAIPEGMKFLQNALEARNVSSKVIAKTILTAEEVVAKMIANASDPEEQMKLEVSGVLGNVTIKCKAKGSSFDAADIERELLFDQEDAEANSVLRRMISKILGDNLTIQNSSGVNTAVIHVQKSPYAGLCLTLLALVLGIGVGLLMQKFLPADVSKGISTYTFVPVYTIFMNLLKMVVAPLVFFSIAASVADFGDIKALGRIAVKIMVFYVITSAIAICIGYLTYQIFPIGNPSVASAVSVEEAAATLAKGEGVNISIKDTIVGIVPSDIVTPFQKSDMLQIIFIAVTMGLAASVLARKFPIARDFLSAFDKIFTAITTALVRFIPLVVFCSMAKMMISMKLGDLASVILWVPVIYFGVALMILVYMLILLVIGGLNPFVFLRKFYPASVTAFTLASSNAALPTSMKQIDEVGVSPKVYSFSLPLGATVNMDGSCITLIISALFFAKIFGVPVTSNVLTSLFISIIVLSLGSPGVPGGNLVCIALLIPQIGIPAEAISLIMGLYPIIGMAQTCANATGDAVVTTVVAKHENMMDLSKYK